MGKANQKRIDSVFKRKRDDANELGEEQLVLLELEQQPPHNEDEDHIMKMKITQMSRVAFCVLCCSLARPTIFFKLRHWSQAGFLGSPHVSYITNIIKTKHSSYSSLRVFQRENAANARLIQKML
jgi:hypothetical protein